jgi:hypothetical protein
MAIMSNGDVLVADAAGNDIIRVTPEGDATTMARFDLETVSTCRRGVLLGQHPRSRLHGRGGRPHRHPGHRHQPEERALYVFELAADGVLAFEAGSRPVSSRRPGS